jgi:16S rRNA C1402 N4-methylase RsmH
MLNSEAAPGEPILEAKREWGLDILTKKPVEAGDSERTENPASRSAKLRVARRVERLGRP